MFSWGIVSPIVWWLYLDFLHMDIFEDASCHEKHILKIYWWITFMCICNLISDFFFLEAFARYFLFSYIYLFYYLW